MHDQARPRGKLDALRLRLTRLSVRDKGLGKEAFSKKEQISCAICAQPICARANMPLFEQSKWVVHKVVPINCGYHDILVTIHSARHLPNLPISRFCAADTALD